MAESFLTKGLVLSQTRHVEYNKIISLLTAEYGLLSVYCYGAMSLKNRNFAGSQPYAFSEFEITKKGDMYCLKEASVIKYFFNPRSTVLCSAAMMYVAEVLSAVCVENNDESEMLRLGLNMFYALGEGKRDISLVKAAFELRCSKNLGFAPQIENSCIICGNKNPLYLDFPGGGLICRECYGKSTDKSSCALLDSVSAYAVKYIVSSDERKFLSLNIGNDESMQLLSYAAEKYLIYQLERNFTSLDFYKSVSK